MRSDKIPPTESTSLYSDIDKKSVEEILYNINEEDQKVALVVKQCIPNLIPFITKVIEKMQSGGRLFYIGAGTSGRLGVLDASEIPPTYGYPKGKVIGVIAGGEKALTSSIEHVEDLEYQGWKDLTAYQISNKDIVLGIASSGTTPYVLGAIKQCKKKNITTAILTSNLNSPAIKDTDFFFVTKVGPEYVTGSTRMKSGTAHKIILNMITTTTMIKLGRVSGNKMSHLQLVNNKLVNRGIRILMEELHVSYEEAKKIINEKEKIDDIIIEKKKKRSRLDSNQ